VVHEIGRKALIATAATSVLCLDLDLSGQLLISLESHLIAARIEQHGDDANAHVFVLARALRAPKITQWASFAKIAAAGIVYLAMIADSYSWSYHFANVVKAGPGKGSSQVSQLHNSNFIERPLWI
jgi:hypothetical protein